MRLHKIVLYDVEWQALRISLNKTFINSNKIDETLSKLEIYLNKASSNEERLNRLWRILNLLNAVRMGFSGMNLLESSQDVSLLNFRSKIQEDYKRIKKICSFKEIEWVEVEKDLNILKHNNNSIFNLIKKDLEKRRDGSLKKGGSIENRVELNIFLKIMDKIE